MNEMFIYIIILDKSLCYFCNILGSSARLRIQQVMGLV